MSEPVTQVEDGCTCGGMAACQQCQDRDAAPVPVPAPDAGDEAGLAEEIAAWWETWDGHALDTGTRLARAALASPWLAGVIAQARADAWDDGYQASTDDENDGHETPNPYREVTPWLAGSSPRPAPTHYAKPPERRREAPGWGPQMLGFPERSEVARWLHASADREVTS